MRQPPTVNSAKAPRKGFRPLARLYCTLLATAIVIMLLLPSCNEGPEYKRPDYPVPSDYLYAPSPEPTSTDTGKPETTYGNVFWWDLLQDDVLKDMIRTALVKNYDARLAAERILQAQAQVGIARAAQFPNVSATAAYQVGKVSDVGPTPIPPGFSDTGYSFSASLQAVFELDFWGRLRKTTEAARAQMLSTVEAQNTVFMTLVSEVASGYLTLRAYDMELEISKQTLASRQDSLRLVTAREEGGKGTMLDVDQAKVLVQTAAKTITQLELQIALEEDYISWLMGANPQKIPRGKSLEEQFASAPIPPGLPSSLLQNRPDIRGAEQTLIAANANITVARAAFFPQILLTGAGGSLSKDLSNLFSPNSYTWGFQPNLLAPVFNAGGIKSRVKVAESQQRQAAIQYLATIQQAFKEVSDALVGCDKQRQYRMQQEVLTETLKDQSRLSNLRYVGGVTSYLEVLDTERLYFESELDLANARLNELLYYVKLYKALGGGWKQQ